MRLRCGKEQICTPSNKQTRLIVIIGRRRSKLEVAKINSKAATQFEDEVQENYSKTSPPFEARRAKRIIQNSANHSKTKHRKINYEET